MSSIFIKKQSFWKYIQSMGPDVLKNENGENGKKKHRIKILQGSGAQTGAVSDRLASVTGLVPKLGVKGLSCPVSLQ